MKPSSWTSKRGFKPILFHGTLVTLVVGTLLMPVQSYVTENKIYCVYIAANEELVREHARLGGFPANHVSQVKTIIDPTTSEDE